MNKFKNDYTFIIRKKKTRIYMCVREGERGNVQVTLKDYLKLLLASFLCFFYAKPDKENNHNRQCYCYCC